MTNSPYASPPNSSGEPGDYPEPGGYSAQGGNQGPGGYGDQDFGSTKFDTFAVVGFIFAFIFAPTAIVLGHIALRKIRISDERGRLLAIWALILGYLGFATAIILIFSFIASITALLSMLPMMGSTSF